MVVVDRIKLSWVRRIHSEEVVVGVNGCFDLLHVGHLELLEFAKSLGDVLVVLVNSDDYVKRVKGVGRPVIPVEQRTKMLDGLKGVDYVCVFDEDTPCNSYLLLKPDVVVKGFKVDDKKFEKEEIVLKKLNTRIVRGFEGKYDEVSTTSIIKSIINK